MGKAVRVMTLLMAVGHAALAIAVLRNPALESVPGKVRPVAMVLLAVCVLLLGFVARATLSIASRRSSAAGLAPFVMPLPKAAFLLPFAPFIAIAELWDSRTLSQSGLIVVCGFTVMAMAVFLPQARFAVVGDRLVVQPAFSLLAGQVARSELASFDCGPSVMHELSTRGVSRRVVVRTLDGDQYTLHLVGVHAEAALAFESSAPRAAPPVVKPAELIPLDHPELQRVVRAGNLATFGFIATALVVFAAAGFLLDLYKLEQSGKPVKVFEVFAVLYRLGGAPLIVAAAAAAISAVLAFLSHVLKEERKVRASLGEDRYWELVFSYEARQPEALRTHGADRKLKRSVYVMCAVGFLMVGGALVAAAVFD